MWAVKLTKQISWSIIVVGLALSILVMHTAPPVAYSFDHIENCDQEDQEETQQVASAKVFANPVSFEINIDPQLFLLSIIPTVEEIDLPLSTVVDESLIENRVLKTIFRRIISPNAP